MKMIKKAVNVSLAFVMLGSAVFAQNLGDAKKAIDAEQYQKAKSNLKALIAAKPADAEPYFYLGNVYLKTDYPDSAKNTYSKGISANGEFALNYVGLGALDLESNNAGGAKGNFDKATSLAKKKDDKPFLYIGKAYTQAPKPDYAKAVQHLEKAKSINDKDAEVYLALGDAYRGQMKNSEAYSAYRTAFDLDKNLVRAKVELGVINKLARAYQEAVNEFNSVVSTNPNYGPVYRELAETYYRWADADTKQYDARMKQALQYYEKYMDLTDRSIESRMRHADFLVLAKEYKALEQEAQEMAKLDKANPRIYRYLGYSAYENKNYPASIQALKDFMTKVDTSRLIANDYLYLGRAQMESGAQAEGITNLKKAVEKDSTNAEVMSDIGKALFGAKKYDQAAEMYTLAANNPKSKTIVYDNFYLGMAYYFDYATKSADKQNPPPKDNLVKADSAFSYVIERSPTTPDPYLYRARVNRLLDDPQAPKGLMVPYYEKYIEIVSARPDAADARYKKPLNEAYSNLGAYYINTDKTKAKEYFNKAIALDPADKYSSDALKALGGK
jgi:tetratricopeptide (TPR) repeat protein